MRRTPDEQRMILDNTTSLTSADCFLRALDQQHVRTGAGNTCHYLLVMNGPIDVDQFRRTVLFDKNLNHLASFRPVRKSFFALPKWEAYPLKHPIPIDVRNCDALFPEDLLNLKIRIDTPPLFRFDILHHPNGNSSLVLTWHHLLMDGFGAALLMKSLAYHKPFQVMSTVPYVPISLKGIWESARAKFFMDKVSQKPLGMIKEKFPLRGGDQKIKSIRFSQEETQSIERTGYANGVRYGLSSHYLACTVRALHALALKNQIPIHDYWVPVPRDGRKKSSTGPILGNHLSFLFYRIPVQALSTLPACIQSIEGQMLAQLKEGISRDYDTLMDYLRRTPSSLYYHWIKGPHGGSLASFLFTVAPEHPNGFTHFNGVPIREAWNFPAGIYPPGFTIAFMSSMGQLHIMVRYFENALSTEDITFFEDRLRAELTNEKPLHENP